MLVATWRSLVVMLIKKGKRRQQTHYYICKNELITYIVVFCRSNLIDRAS